MLKSHPFGRGGSTWALAWRSVAAEQAAGRGVRGSAGFEAADSDDLLPGPNLQHEGAAAAADDGVGAIAGVAARRHRSGSRPGGGEELRR